MQLELKRNEVAFRKGMAAEMVRRAVPGSETSVGGEIQQD